MRKRYTGLGSKMMGRKEDAESRKDKTTMFKERLERGRHEDVTGRRKEKHRCLGRASRKQWRISYPRPLRCMGAMSILISQHG